MWLHLPFDSTRDQRNLKSLPALYYISSLGHYAPTPKKVGEPSGSGLDLTTSCPASPTSQMGSAHCPGQKHVTCMLQGQSWA